MARIIPAEGAVLERGLDTAHSTSSEGLSRHALASVMLRA